MERVQMDRFEMFQRIHEPISHIIVDLKNWDNYHPYSTLVSIETPSVELNTKICDFLFKEFNTNPEWLKLLDEAMGDKK